MPLQQQALIEMISILIQTRVKYTSGMVRNGFRLVTYKGQKELLVTRELPETRVKQETRVRQEIKERLEIKELLVTKEPKVNLETKEM